MDNVFTESLDVILKGREFRCEATPTNVVVGRTPDGEDITEFKYTARVFEGDAVVNVGNMPKFDREDAAIQWGFEWCKAEVK